MSTVYNHGVQTTEITNGARPMRVVNTSVIGLVATAADADAAVFPENTPVLIAGDPSSIASAGVTGTLKKSLEAIFDVSSPMIVVVRVPEGVDAAATTLNLIGSQGDYTGVWALLRAQTDVGVKPRILGVPGLDVQTVSAELLSVADKLRAFAYISGIGAETTAVTTYRDNFGSKRGMMLWPDFKDAQGTAWATSRAMGLRAWTDNAIGWHRCISNLEVNGVTGVSIPVHWELQDPNSAANYLNSNEVTTIKRDGGFKFHGCRTLSTDPLFAFESAVRTGDILADTIAEGIAWAVDKPMSKTLINDILETINAKFRWLTTMGYIVGANAYLAGGVNTELTLAAGELHIHYDYTPVPPAENINLYQEITSSYLGKLAA